MKKFDKEEKQLQVFKELILNFSGFIDNNYHWYFMNYEKPLRLGILNLDNSIMENLDSFIVKSSKRLKSTPEYKNVIENYRSLLLSLAQADIKIKNQFYNTSLLDVILERKLKPYEQTNITRLAFDPEIGIVSKKHFLHEQCEKVMAGGKDFRIINSLDSLKNIEAPFFFEDEIYNQMIDYLINTYLKEYDKLDKDEFSEYIIRLVYRHINKGFVNLTKENLESIAYCFMYNCWPRMLKIFINKADSFITKESLDDLQEKILGALNDRTLAETVNREEYAKMRDVYDELLTLFNERREAMTLIRKK